MKERWAAQHPEPVLPAQRHRRPPVGAHVQRRVPGVDLLPLRVDRHGLRGDRRHRRPLRRTQPNELVTGLLLATIVLMLASQFVPPRVVERAQVQLHDPRPRPPGGLPRRRAHRHRRPRPRRRRPLHLLPVLMTTTDAAATPAPAPAGRPRRGEQPAGRVLLVDGPRLGLAALVNADALVDRAERKPLGHDRDRSLAVWHPVQDVANVTQISRLRDLGDWLAGNEDEGGSGVPLDVDPDPGSRRTRCGPPSARRPPTSRCASTSAATRSSATRATRSSTSPRQPAVRHDPPLRERHRPHPPGLLRLARRAPGGHGRRTDPRWRSSSSAATTRRGSWARTARPTRARATPLARGVRPPGGGRDGHPPRRRPHRVLGGAPADARRRLRRPRRGHERDLPRGRREPAVDDLPRHRPDLR